VLRQVHTYSSHTLIKHIHTYIYNICSYLAQGLPIHTGLCLPGNEGSVVHPLDDGQRIPEVIRLTAFIADAQANEIAVLVNGGSIL